MYFTILVIMANNFDTTELKEIASTVGSVLGNTGQFFNWFTAKYPKGAELTPYLGIIQSTNDPESRGRVRISKAANPDVTISEWMNIPGFTSGIVPPEMVGKMCYCLAINGDIKRTIILGLHGEDNTSLPLQMAYVKYGNLPECNQKMAGTAVLAEKAASDVFYVCKKTNSAFTWTPIGDVSVITSVDSADTNSVSGPGEESKQVVGVPKGQIYFVSEGPNVPAYPVYNSPPNIGTPVAQRPANCAILTPNASARALCTTNTVGTIALLDGKDGLNQTPMICAKKNGVPTWVRLGNKEETMVFDPEFESTEVKIGTKMQDLLANKQSALSDWPTEFSPTKHASSGRITNPLDLTSFITIPSGDFDEQTIDDITRTQHLNAEQEAVVLRSILSKFIKAFKVCDNNITLIEYYLGIVTTGFHGIANDMLDMSYDIERNADALKQTESAYDIRNGSAARGVVNKAERTKSVENTLQNNRGLYRTPSGEKKPIPGLIGRVAQAKQLLDEFTELTGTGLRPVREGEANITEVRAETPVEIEKNLNPELASIKILQDSFPVKLTFPF